MRSTEDVLYGLTAEDIREIHPDYPSPFGGNMNALYIEHALRVRAYFESKLRVPAEVSVTVTFDDLDWAEIVMSARERKILPAKLIRDAALADAHR